MTLFTGSQQDYYQGRNLGNYQFTSLQDVVNYFMLVYVGENKIIPKASRTDVAFHAQRALQELSFDTFKSIKSQEITLPPNLTMSLPHDYVNYTKISFSDDSGIQRVLQPVSKTSNPFSVKQTESGEYAFSQPENFVYAGDFSIPAFTAEGFTKTPPHGKSAIWESLTVNGVRPKYKPDDIVVENEKLVIKHLANMTGAPHTMNTVYGRSYGIWQSIDVSDIGFLDLSAIGTSANNVPAGSGTRSNYGVLRIGLTAVDPATRPNADQTNPIHPTKPSSHFNPDFIELGYVEWNNGTTSEKSLSEVDVTDHSVVWVYIQSYVQFFPGAITLVSTYDDDSDPSTAEVSTLGTSFMAPSSSVDTNYRKNIIDDIVVSSSQQPLFLQPSRFDNNSRTWTKYKEHKNVENAINDYQDFENNVYWPNEGERYGLDPQHAQINGSFYIDQLRGLINFSSVLSGKDIILEYISDGLGTEEEMKVHKFAEEAMYKSIMYAILSTSSFGQAIAPRFKKEKFAAIRQAKIRLSNLKIEELTQVLRGKSKHIKH